jgi:hypothetical protein
MVRPGYARPVRARARRPLLVAAAVLAAAALAVGLAKAAARVTEDPVVWALAGWTIPGDYGVFLGAAHQVLDGESPYPSGELAPPPAAYYVYPPPLALLVVPFAAIDDPVTASSWTLLGIGAVVLGLLVLGVRDPRCHALALLYPGTREALEYGAIGTFLLLLLALAWRFRGRVAAAAAATAGAVVLKLFLWPLLVWHLLVGRGRTAVAAAAAAAGLALASWAVIGFRGLADYPDVLRRLTDLEAAETYSLFALGRAAGLPEGAAQAVALAVGVALLAAAAVAARPRTEVAEARALVLALAAAFALTPILWQHYLVLLALPVALARRSFSPLWLLPLAGVVFEALGLYGGWVYGDVPALLSVLGLVAATTAASLSALGPRPAAAQAAAAPAGAREATSSRSSVR